MRGLCILFALAGCRQIFGLSDPHPIEQDAPAHADDSSLVDVASQGPVAHYAFDEITGNKTPDDVGHYDATTTDTTRPTVVIGHRANALELQNPDYLVIPATITVDLSQGFTFALWVEVLTLPGNTFGCLLAQAHTLSLCVVASGDVVFATTSNNHANSLTAPHALTVNQWAHLAVSYNGQAKNIYINGVLEASTMTNITSSIDVIYVGAAPGATLGLGSYVNAAIDELVIYDGALDAAAVHALFMQ